MTNERFGDVLSSKLIEAGLVSPERAAAEIVGKLPRLIVTASLVDFFLRAEGYLVANYRSDFRLDLPTWARDDHSFVLRNPFYAWLLRNGDFNALPSQFAEHSEAKAIVTAGMVGRFRLAHKIESAARNLLSPTDALRSCMDEIILPFAEQRPNLSGGEWNSSTESFKTIFGDWFPVLEAIRNDKRPQGGGGRNGNDHSRRHVRDDGNLGAQGHRGRRRPQSGRGEKES
jgi:hypothetical protein